MFEFPVENRFESSQICSKIGPKSDQNGGLGRVRNRMGTRIDPEPQRVKLIIPFWGSFWGSVWVLTFDIFCVFSERVLFASLGPIGEGKGGKVLPKGSKKVSKRDHFEVRVDFWKQSFYYSKTIIFEVLEVLGDDLETLSEMKAAKWALEKCLRVSFCRFDEIF